MHGVMTVIAFGTTAGIVVAPLLYGLATLYRMKRPKTYPLLLRVTVRADRPASR